MLNSKEAKISACQQRGCSFSEIRSLSLTSRSGTKAPRASKLRLVFCRVLFSLLRCSSALLEVGKFELAFLEGGEAGGGRELQVALEVESSIFSLLQLVDRELELLDGLEILGEGAWTVEGEVFFDELAIRAWEEGIVEGKDVGSSERVVHFEKEKQFFFVFFLGIYSGGQDHHVVEFQKGYKFFSRMQENNKPN